MSQNAQVCSACGLPPRQSSKTSKPIPLRRCSQCQNAWYHDVRCQREHFPKHRKHCRAQRTVSKSSHSTGKSIMYHIERRENRGRCMVASRCIPVGEPIPPNGHTGLYDPLVPPVLNADHRSSRCTLCFRQLTQGTTLLYNENKHNPNYPVLFCSSECREKGRLWISEEEKAVVEVCPPTKRGQTIMPTALLLFRILCTVASEGPGEETEKTVRQGAGFTRSQIDDLEAQDRIGSAEEQQHAHVVVRLVTQLLLYISRYSKSFSDDTRKRLTSFSAEYIAGVLSKMKTNCFSICDGESVAIGLGLFPIASNINHCCQPNAIQTFMYGERARLPRLGMTACSTIKEKEEICISYIDCSCPRDARRDRLKEGYSFWCTCHSCTDDEKDNLLVGLRCLTVGCQGRGVRHGVTNTQHTLWTCDKCSSTNFQRALESIRKFSSMSPLTSISHDFLCRREYCRAAESIYKELKSTCYPTSWYVRAAGERLLQSYLECISDQNSEGETRELCSRSLVVAEDILSSIKDGQVETWADVRNSVLRFKAAKLRMYLMPNPLQALQELQDVYRHLSLYFPENHELIEGIRVCMREGSM